APVIVEKRQKGKNLYLYYGQTNLISGLAWMPLIEIFIMLLFLILIFYNIRSLRQLETGNLWISFTKETAHQLGTPISSLLGWMELFRVELDKKFPISKEEIEEIACNMKKIINQMEGDIEKLNKIVVRFSRIGSVPELKDQDINDILKNQIAYFRERLPQIGRQISILENYGNIPLTKVNKDLIEWVIENLLKNSVDAIIKSEGMMEVETIYNSKEECIVITHSDNGRGIQRDSIKKIFQPGYSTKKRGWGLGLALAKRIITDYHKGTIAVTSSEPNRGTTFTIKIPVL
ncbi:MAG: HAMP domain-containing sensor histidine kinase, partial [bacterium]